MGLMQSMIQYLKEYIFLNPIAWGIIAVSLWIIGSAFIKALRRKDEEEDGEG
jgi:hypothetical protein